MPTTIRARGRVAVIGAGLAGLAAANVLVDQGVDTMVYERRSEPGGRARTTDLGPYRVNLGPHALYARGETQRFLDRLGLDLPGPAPALTGAQALRHGRLWKLPVSARSLAATSLLGPRGKLRWARLSTRLARTTGQGETGSVAGWVAANATGTEALLLEALIRLFTYAHAPDLLSAEAALAQVNLAASSGVRYLDGGWASLIEALANRAQARGAIITHQPVARAQDLLDQVDGVIVAAGPPRAAAELVGLDGPDRAALAEAAGPPVEAAVLELGLSAVPPTRFVLGIDEPLYGSVHAPPARLAPPGHAVVHLARYLTPGEDHPSAEAEAQLWSLARGMGVTDGLVEESRYLHRMTVAGGLPLATGGGRPGRPGVDHLGLALGHDRILVAGDWVGSDGLLADAAVASAHTAAHRLAAVVGVG